VSEKVPRILFVCLGNICRSPLAEAFLKRDAQAAGIKLEVDSAGTGGWHEGDLPDERAQAVGKARGGEMTMRARQVRSRDFKDFDLIVAMDSQNERDLLHWKGADQPKVRLACSFVPNCPAIEVPDPYYGGPSGFEKVADLLEDVSQGVLREIREGLLSGNPSVKDA
jgi:protein-tyrosine phosphatase